MLVLVPSVPRRDSAPTAAQQNVQKPAVPKKRESTKACETETAISRTEPKGLKEKLRRDMGVIQAVKKACVISAGGGERAEPRCHRTPGQTGAEPDTAQERNTRDPGKPGRLGARSTPSQLPSTDRKLAVEKHFHNESSPQFSGF